MYVNYYGTGECSNFNLGFETILMYYMRVNFFIYHFDLCINKLKTILLSYLLPFHEFTKNIYIS